MEQGEHNKTFPSHVIRPRVNRCGTPSVFPLNSGDRGGETGEMEIYFFLSFLMEHANSSRMELLGKGGHHVQVLAPTSVSAVTTDEARAVLYK